MLAHLARPALAVAASLRPIASSSRVHLSRHYAALPQIPKTILSVKPADQRGDWKGVDALVAKNRTDGGPKTAAQTWAERSDKLLKYLKPPPNPYIGRSVEVFGDVGEALRKMNRILASNRVFHERRLVARHEKKGYKRRRLASQRWRRRFAHEVRKKVELVKAIRRRGA